MTMMYGMDSVHNDKFLLTEVHVVQYTIEECLYFTNTHRYNILYNKVPYIYTQVMNNAHRIQ